MQEKVCDVYFSIIGEELFKCQFFRNWISLGCRSKLSPFLLVHVRKNSLLFWIVTVAWEAISRPINDESGEKKEYRGEHEQFFEVFVAIITTGERIWSGTVDEIDEGPSNDIQNHTSYKLASREPCWVKRGTIVEFLEQFRALIAKLVCIRSTYRYQSLLGLSPISLVCMKGRKTKVFQWHTLVGNANRFWFSLAKPCYAACIQVLPGPILYPSRKILSHLIPVKLATYQTHGDCAWLGFVWYLGRDSLG